MQSNRTVLISLLLLVVLSSCITPPSAPARSQAPATDDTPATGANVAYVAVEPAAFIDFDPSSTCLSELWVLVNVYETLTRYTPLGSKDALDPGWPRPGPSQTRV